MQNLLAKNLKKKRKAWNERIEDYERLESKRSKGTKKKESSLENDNPSLESELTKMRGRLA